jgi:hypothetical protein
MMNEPYTREEFEKFARISKGGSGYVEKKMIATVRMLNARIDAVADDLRGLGTEGVLQEHDLDNLLEMLYGDEDV